MWLFTTAHFTKFACILLKLLGAKNRSVITILKRRYSFSITQQKYSKMSSTMKSPLDGSTRKKTSLDGGSEKPTRRSSHTKDNFCSVTVRKSDPKQKAGIRLEQETDGRIRVSNIASNGLFADSEIEIGDIVLSINSKRLTAGQGPEDLVDVIRNAKTKVTVVVKKTNMEPRKEAPVKKNPDEISDNNTVRRDSYYTGKTKHKRDGSISLKYTDADDKKAAQTTDVTTISATKAIENEDAGLVFAIHNKMLFLSEMAADSIFQDTSLEVGDRVLSINDMNFRGYADAAQAQTIVKKAKKAVTVIVEKGVAGFQKPRKSILGKKKQPIVSDDDSSVTQSLSSTEDQVFALKTIKYTEVVIAAPKAFAKQEVGLEFEQKNGHVCVYKIKPNSIFLSTSLEVGDRVLSVNDVDFLRTPDKNLARTTCQESRETVSLLVLKDESKYTQHEFNLDASSTNLTWQ
jgi:C-terminal processing protease CtpA/Prc